jgi:hypothetical protein
MTGPSGPVTPEIDHSGYTGPGFDQLIQSFEPHLPAAHPDAVAPPQPVPGSMSPSVSLPSTSTPTRSAPHRLAPPRPLGPMSQQTTAPPVHTGPTPRTLQETAEPSAAPPVEKKGRGGLVAAALAVLLLGTGVGVGGILLLGGDKKPSPPPPSPSPTSTAPSAATTTPAVPAQVMRAATPRELRAVGRGPLAGLRWKLARNNDYPIMVQQSDETGTQPPQALPKRTLSTTISGLDPAKGYCFTVGAIVALGQSDGQAATIAWSKPACIRGAHVQ